MHHALYTILICCCRYCEGETLSGDNQVYCSNCKEHRDHTKKVEIWKVDVLPIDVLSIRVTNEIWKLPQILICHFKRFCMSSAGERFKDSKVHPPSPPLLSPPLFPPLPSPPSSPFTAPPLLCPHLALPSFPSSSLLSFLSLLLLLLLLLLLFLLLLLPPPLLLGGSLPA
jgi:hypothetical protein